MIIEALLATQILLLARLIRAVKGPEIVYHRRKRMGILMDKIKEFFINIWNRLIALVNKVKGLF